MDAVERAELNEPFIEPLCGRLLNAPVEKGAETLLKLEIDQKLLRRRAEPQACLFVAKALGPRFQLIRSRVPWRIERLQGVSVQQEQKRRLQVGNLIAAVVEGQGGAMAYIEDSSVESDSWRSLHSKDVALLFVGFEQVEAAEARCVDTPLA